MRLNIKLSPKSIRIILIGVAIVIATISLISEYVFVNTSVSDDSIWLDFLDLWSVNVEQSIPTWYSVIILFITVVCLLAIAYGKTLAKDSYAAHWWGLAALFTYLSMDEGAVIHEIVAIPLQTAFGTSGFFAFGWQIVAIPLVIIFGIVYLRFLLHLPEVTRNGFILSAILYAGGALIIEGISASQYDENSLTMLYLSIATLEEFLEILGVSLFIYTLLEYLQTLDYSLLINSGNEIDNSHYEPIEKIKPNIQKSLLAWNPMILLLVFLTLTNIVSLAWILGQRPQEVSITEAIAFYEPMLQELEASGIVIVETPDIFGIENSHSLSVVRALASEYSEIYVVALPSESVSVIFAGDTIALDRDMLTEALHAQGIIEFIIFDSASVMVILEN